jgi:hypothetical protein
MTVYEDEIYSYELYLKKILYNMELLKGRPA